MTELPTILRKPAPLSQSERQAASRSAQDPETSLPRVPELLSPAGDWEALKAAVANGADAVFFGLDNFNARHRAANFRLDELHEIVRYLHAHNVRGCLTLNTLIFSDELPEVQAYVRAVAEAGVDAVIVQDLGLCRILREMAPTLAIHASTQMTLTEPRGVEWVRRLGVVRAVLARELSLDEIRKTALGLADRQRATGLQMPDLEVFVHGALCVSYSGQCLTSEALGGRSANRGQCAQACRLPYDLLVDGAVRDLGDKAYLLSPQDLAAYDLVADLADAGVACLKIEGRLKSAHYVAATTQTYRAAIDSAAAGERFAIPEQQKADLEQTFSRGFTHGFLSGVNHQRLVHARFPKSRGRRIGTVESVRGQHVVLALDPALARQAAQALKPGDGIVFDEGHPEQDEQGGRIYTAKVLPLPTGRARNLSQSGSLPGPRIEIELMRGDANLAAVATGAIVWKTDDPSLRRRLEHSFSRDTVARRIPLTATVVAHTGKHLSLTLVDGQTVANAQWTEKPLEPAAKFPATEALLREQLARLGETPYELTDLTADLAGGPMIPKSVLNDLRRQCTDRLLSDRESRRPHPINVPDPLTALRAKAAELKSPSSVPASPSVPPSLRASVPAFSPSVPASPSVPPSLSASVPAFPASVPAFPSPSLHVLVRDLPQLDAVLAWRDADPANAALLSGIYADYEDVRRYKDAVAKCRAASGSGGAGGSGGGGAGVGSSGVPITLATVRIIKPREEGFTRFILDLAPDALLVRNLTSMAVAQELAPAMPLIGDHTLNVANELTADLLLRDGGFARLVPSYDLSWKQMGAMFTRIDPGFFECVVHQHMPMFHMEHCVFSHLLSNGTDYRTCGRPCEAHRVELRDRQGQPHPLLADVGCRNTVFNAAAQSALEYIPEMQRLGIHHYRLELLREPAQDVAPLLGKYAAVLRGQADAKTTVRSLRVLSQLGVTGVTRGTLDRE